MSWCDKLASVPSVGFKFDASFLPGDAIFRALSPVLGRLAEGDKVKFTVDKHDSFAVTFSTEDGFQYGVEPSRIYIDFRHRLRAKPVSGGPPVMEMLSKPLPFSELLPITCSKLVEATLLVKGTKEQTLNRVGIITKTSVSEDDLPPGIVRLVKYVARPWDCVLDNYSIRITAEIEKNADWSDRCIHVLTKPDDPDELLSVNFDWQRQFTKSRPVTKDTLEAILKDAQKSALVYFEDLAEGSRFDEELLRSAT